MRNPIQSNPLKFLPLALPLALLQVPGLEASILFLETFETDGQGVRYTASGMFTDGADDYFIRTDGSTEASGIPAFTGFGGSYFWAAEDIDATENTSGVAILDFPGISLGGLPEIQISLDLGAGSNSVFDSVDDFIFVQFSIDSGPWETALAFQNNGQVFNGPLLHDTDFDSIGDGTELGLAFQTISSPFIAVSGSFMDIRIDTLMTSGSEAVGFDNLQVIGVPEPNTTALAFGIASLLLLLARRFLPQRENESRA
jgi:hypothetical protein